MELQSWSAPPPATRRKNGCSGGDHHDDNHRARGASPRNDDVSECCCSPSCTAGAIADCVALCCCPLAVVNFLALAFVRIPWTVGRRCIGTIRRNRKKKKKKKKRKGALMMEMVTSAGGVGRGDLEEEGSSGSGGNGEDGDVIYVVERSDGSRSLRMVGDIDEEDVAGGGGGGRRRSAKYEAEKVWLELYQVGHLGFGRVSFTGISTTLS
ncbi:unnamed protein product [Linum trigynum]|uniref:Uncharacterized protein n=1 Tax=Linum trigynum TaxID=586398 RepID=A0AAV2CP82_9ROSI